MAEVQQSGSTPNPQPVTPTGAVSGETLEDKTVSAGQEKREISIGGEQVRFNLSDLYSGIDDPRIVEDVAKVEQLCKDFDASFRGKLATNLGEAMEALEAMSREKSRLGGFLNLMQACDSGNQVIQRVAGQVSERLSRASGNHLAFFDIEVAKIDDQVYAALLQNDARVARYHPMIKEIREQASHQLSEEVERALSLRSPFGMGEWSELINERKTALRFRMDSEVYKGEEFYGKDLRLEQALTIVSEHPRREVRSETLRIVNTVLKEDLAPFMTRALNIAAGRKNVEDSERKYQGVMTSRNLDNMVSDEVVNALHKSVADTGPELCQRYYKLLAKHLGVEKLEWSDRNAPLPGSEQTIPWDVAVDIVRKAYRSFSPTLAGLVDKMIDSGWIDAPNYEGKRGGAFNMSLVLPDPLGCRAYTLLNYLGKPGDVSTFAHELGHGVHGMLAGEAQGSLMFHAPIAYCETASIFAEMVTFEYLKEQCATPQEKLALLMGKINDFMNTVVRQTGFSNFEQRIHEARKDGKLTSDMMNKHWMETTEQLYGKDGEVFEYRNMDNLWSYVTHFLRPFYVYGYAFGELLTQSLYAVKDSYGDRFEPLYLDLLKAGGTKDAAQLLAPFGLDPGDPQFWSKGMQASVGKWLSEAEELSKQLGIGVDDSQAGQATH